MLYFNYWKGVDRQNCTQSLVYIGLNALFFCNDLSHIRIDDFRQLFKRIVAYTNLSVGGKCEVSTFTV